MKLPKKDARDLLYLKIFGERRAFCNMMSIGICNVLCENNSVNKGYGNTCVNKQ